MNTTSKAAADRLAKGIKPGDFVLFGERNLKVRVPAPDGDTIRNYTGRTMVQHLGLVTEVTPTGRLRVQEEHGDRQYRIFLLSAKDSLNAAKLTEAQVARRRSCLPGWE